MGGTGWKEGFGGRSQQPLLVTRNSWKMAPAHFHFHFSTFSLLGTLHRKKGAVGLSPTLHSEAFFVPYLPSPMAQNTCGAPRAVGACVTPGTPQTRNPKICKVTWDETGTTGMWGTP